MSQAGSDQIRVNIIEKARPCYTLFFVSAIMFFFKAIIHASIEGGMTLMHT